MTTTTTTVRTIRLPNGKSVSLSTYVIAWRQLLTTDPSFSMRGWDHFPTDAGTILGDMRYGMHDRINRHIPGYGVGRKWSSDWYWAAWRTAREVNTPRLRVYSVPADLRARLAHRIASRED